MDMNNTHTMNNTDTTYNGWTNYETWNVALWIANDQGLYNMARRSYSYQDFISNFEDGDTTLDGVKWNDGVLDIQELNEMLSELG